MGVGICVFMQTAHQVLIHVGVTVCFLKCNLPRRDNLTKQKNLKECARAEERRRNNQVIIDCLFCNYRISMLLLCTD